MNTTFDIATTQDCMLVIQDTTQSYDEYLEEDSNNYIRPGRFKYSDTFTVNVIKYVSSEESEVDNMGGTIKEVIITPHLKDENYTHCDEATYSLQVDGHYIIDHLILPSVDCIKYLIIEEFPVLAEYQYIYATDGIQFYKFINNEAIVVPIEEILNINSEITTISRASQDTFSLCIMHHCYLSLYKQKFDQLMSKKCITKNDVNNLDVDLLWIALNTIKYNVEFGFLTQAQRTLENFTRCYTICGTSTNNNKNGCNCG